MATPVSPYFDIPRFYYFASKNVFTGSKGQVFNYKITPADTLKVQIWHGWLCSDLAEMEQEQEFPMEQAGYDAMIQWLEAQYQQEQKTE
jgi:hypothetical protein